MNSSRPPVGVYVLAAASRFCCAEAAPLHHLLEILLGPSGRRRKQQRGNHRDDLGQSPEVGRIDVGSIRIHDTPPYFRNRRSLQSECHAGDPNGGSATHRISQWFLGSGLYILPHPPHASWGNTTQPAMFARESGLESAPGVRQRRCPTSYLSRAKKPPRSRLPASRSVVIPPRFFQDHRYLAASPSTRTGESAMQAVNLYDSATFERGIPHDYFSWLREHEPVHWQPPREIKSNVAGIMNVEQRGYWAVTRHEDIIEVSLDQKRFSSERGTVITTDINEERIAQLRLWMINQDAPRHTKLRKLINKGFTKRMIDTMESLHPEALSRDRRWRCPQGRVRLRGLGGQRVAAARDLGARRLPSGGSGQALRLVQSADRLRGPGVCERSGCHRRPDRNVRVCGPPGSETPLRSPGTT